MKYSKNNNSYQLLDTHYVSSSGLLFIYFLINSLKQSYVAVDFVLFYGWKSKLSYRETVWPPQGHSAEEDQV